MNNEKKVTKMHRRDVLSCRFYIEFVLMIVIGVGIACLSGMLDTLSGIGNFADVVTIIFAVTAALLVGSVVYKILAVKLKKENTVLSSNFALVWSAVLFVASAVLFIQTLDYSIMRYDISLTVFTVILVVYAVLAFANFFLGGDFFEKLLKKALARKSK